jgi:DNA-binding response OmpR family regulator
MASPNPGGRDEPPGIILIVEDEVLVRMSLAEYLRECGYAVLEAANGDEAIEILQARGNEIDLVFSDVQMPGATDGFALARWIRTHIDGVRVLLTSGVAHAAEKAEGLCLDGPIVQKPYDHATLLAGIKRLREKVRKEARPSF